MIMIMIIIISFSSGGALGEEASQDKEVCKG